MVAVSFFGVGGALGPAHGEPGNSQGGDVREIVYGVIEEGDRVSEKSADNFRDDEQQSSGDGPDKQGGPPRGVSAARIPPMVAGRAVGVGMRGGCRENVGVVCSVVG